MRAHPRRRRIRPGLLPASVVPPKNPAFVLPLFAHTARDNRCSCTRSARSMRSKYTKRIYAACRGAFARLCVGGAREWVSLLEDWRDTLRRYLELGMSIQYQRWTVRDSIWPTVFGSRAATRQAASALKMFVNLEPVRVNRRTFSRRERKRIPFVHSDRFRHLVIPRADVRTHEVEDALQRGYQHL